MVAVDVPQGGLEEDNMSWKDFCSSCSEGAKERTGKDWAMTFARIIGVTACLYFFLFSLDLMGNSFKILGGCSAGDMFSGASNPIAGLMIGILATVLVQSSSTSTSIVVSLVGAGTMDVQTAIPVIMGANIGTSVTNTIVAMGQMNDPEQFERAFAGATVHDMFNFLSVLVLLPIEAATHVIYWITFALKPDDVSDGESWTGPVKLWVGPLVKIFVQVDKKMAANVALGKTTCEAAYAKVAAGAGPCGDDKATGLIKCKCDDDTGLIKLCPAFYTEKGTWEDDNAAGGVLLFISLIFLTVCLALMVKLLQSMILGTSSKMLRKATSLNDYVAMVVGTGITILVQSSSVTTSVLTPLVGVGVIPVEKMFPLTLGANIGTTMTAILASLVSSKTEAVQIALAHLLFNLIGIMIWYPVPWMRQWPLRAAKGLGSMTRRYRGFPLLYILFAFVICPGILLGTSTLFEKGSSYTILGVMVVVAVATALVWFLFWWNKRDGKSIFFNALEARQDRTDLMASLPLTVKDMQARMAVLEKGLGAAAGKTLPTTSSASVEVESKEL